MAKLMTNMPKGFKSIKKDLPASVKAIRIYRILLYISLFINLFLLYQYNLVITLK